VLRNERLTELAKKRREAVDLLRRKGIRHCITEILRITSIYRTAILSELKLDRPIPNVPAHVPIVIDLLNPNAVDELAAFCDRVHYRSLAASEIRSRLNQGHLCFVARHNGQIIHFSWAAFDSCYVEEVGLRIHLAPSEGYVYDMYTSPEFRSKGVARARIGWTLTYLRNAGYKRVYSFVLPGNIASQRASKDLGFTTDGWLSRITLGPLALTLYRPIRNESKPH